MSTAWNRRVMVATDKHIFDMNNIDIEFTITKKEGSDPATCELVIFNLNKSTRDSFYPQQPVSIYAGYGDHFGMLFNGVVNAVWSNKREEDISTTFICTEDAVKYNTASLSKSWTDGTPYQKIVDDALVDAGYEPGNIIIPKRSDGSEWKVKGCYEHTGQLKDLLENVADDTGAKFNIDNGYMINMYPGESTNGNLVDISPRYGLISAHEKWSAENSKGSKSSATIPSTTRVRTLFPGDVPSAGQVDRVGEVTLNETGVPYSETISDISAKKYKQEFEIEAMINHNIKVGNGIIVRNSEWIPEKVFKVTNVRHICRGDSFHTESSLSEVLDA